jgi:hypothetical protein
MSYSIRNDKQGWRAVDGPDDVGPDEYYSETPIEIIPAVAVPVSVTMRQARLALHSAGLLSQVEAAIDALPEPPRTEARIEWDFSSEVFRERDFVKMLGASLGLTSEQMDELFITAATL